MVDLIVPSGTVLQIDSSFNVEPKYEHFRMEANATIRCDVDLVLHADRAEFAEDCLIDARGKAGAPGTDAPQQPPVGRRRRLSDQHAVSAHQPAPNQ
jgi:hypothetical protein